MRIDGFNDQSIEAQKLLLFLKSTFPSFFLNKKKICFPIKSILTSNLFLISLQKVSCSRFFIRQIEPIKIESFKLWFPLKRHLECRFLEDNSNS